MSSPTPTTSTPEQAAAPLSPEQRRELEQLYAQTISTAVLLARTLGKPCPIVRREDRRQSGGRS